LHFISESATLKIYRKNWRNKVPILHPLEIIKSGDPEDYYCSMCGEDLAAIKEAGSTKEVKYYVEKDRPTFTTLSVDVHCRECNYWIHFTAWAEQKGNEIRTRTLKWYCFKK
jgi:hypothetical protein